VAADEGQTVVENALEQLFSAPRPVISAKEVLGMIHTWRDLQQQWRERPPLIVCLTTMAGQYEEVMQRAEKEGWSHRQVLRHLCESEAVERAQKRTARLLSESGLPETKTLSTLG
jgi:hypothetical protein